MKSVNIMSAQIYRHEPQWFFISYSVLKLITLEGKRVTWLIGNKLVALR
jgi:hypothetical protein